MASDVGGPSSGFVKTGLKKFLSKITFTRVSDHANGSCSDDKSFINSQQRKESFKS